PPQPSGIVLPEGTAYWAVNGVRWAMENGISDGQRPAANVTRQEVMQMLFNFYNFSESNCDCSAVCGG
ncbi:MAG: hypothetical protein FWC70_04775, partial [Defluviitaleaceae bacterium]|nr:hypothetical protein [Defluviitaleaceae bacterium]